MQAMYGLADFFRFRTRVIGCAAAAALALSALVLALAPSARAAEPPHKTYLGLGNSLAFGYSRELFNENFPGEDPHKFEEALPAGSHKPNGYVLDYWLKLVAKQTPASTWNRPVNDGCPAETTDSFIGNGRTGKELETKIPGTHGSAPCLYKYVKKYHLHHEYKGPSQVAPSGQSQLENTLEEIAKASKSDHPVQLITLDIGGNDVLNRIAQCRKEVAEGLFEGFGTPEEQLKVCEEASAGPLFTHVLTNIAGIMFAIRNGSMFCSEDCDGDADDFGVNYTGKIVFDGFYDPFGSVFVPGMELQPGSNLLELLLNAKAKKTVEPFAVCYANPQSNPVNPAHPTAFNPLVDGEPLPEPERLQAWTNMANFTYAKKEHTHASGEVKEGSTIVKGLGGWNNGVKSANELEGTTPENAGGELVKALKVPAGTKIAKVNSATEIELTNPVEGAGGKTVKEQLTFFAKNGPLDIHPRPLGYEVLANNIEEECP